MQGFNRYIPPDFDPRKTSTLNQYQGKKHALGDRARKIDQGILIVRFELPFNIWCGTCNSHIGAGVRYNAEKKKVGNYYSTPIYGFRCKCHLCSGWFEIRTDPKNAAYLVHEGAKKKDEDWDPAENGGYRILDTEAPSNPSGSESGGAGALLSNGEPDPFAALEKTIAQAKWANKGTSRLTELSEASDRLGADPYDVSRKLRGRFREEKRVMLEKQGRDDGLREKYGLGADLDLGTEDGEASGDGGEAREASGAVRDRWIAGRQRRGLPVDLGPESEVDLEDPDGQAFSSGPSTPVGGPGPIRTPKSRSSAQPTDGLAASLRKSTKRRYDPFAEAADVLLARAGRSKGRINGGVGGLVAAVKPTDGTAPASSFALAAAAPPVSAAQPPSRQTGGVGGLLAGYESD